MSLRAFHLLFIVVAAVMFFGTSVWALFWTSEVGLAVKLLGLVSALLGSTLVGYGIMFQRKARKLIL